MILSWYLCDEISTCDNCRISSDVVSLAVCSEIFKQVTGTVK